MFRKLNYLKKMKKEIIAKFKIKSVTIILKELIKTATIALWAYITLYDLKFYNFLEEKK
jgi:aryl carrier-like protein